MFFCPKCKTQFLKRRGLQSHFLSCRYTQSSCPLQQYNEIVNIGKSKNTQHGEFQISSPLANIENKEYDTMDLNNIFDDSNSVDNSFSEESQEKNAGQSLSCSISHSCNSILMKAKRHFTSGMGEILDHESEYKTAVELLANTKKARMSVYVFDAIMNWAKTCSIKYNVNYSDITISRKKIFEIINRKYDLKDLTPNTTQIYCSGYGGNVDVIWHEFDECLYSLLMDRELMKPENLLWNDADACESNKRVYDDVNSGSVYKEAYKKYIVDSSKEKLIPIIFFTDKTHTDIHGRLCLEPVQFTLGIFNREIRNNPRAWRTLGYANDLLYRGKCETKDKLQDYHDILKAILESFKKRQRTPLQWQFFGQEDEETIYILHCPVLFIIGDTEGHDRLCGRMTSRGTISHLCRYCDVCREDTDNPYCTYRYTKMKMVQSLYRRGDECRLKEELSMYLISNAWHDIEFCDPIRGIHGATCGELLHCLQQGIFEYSLIQLFELKKESKRKLSIQRGKNKQKRQKENAPTYEDKDSDVESEANTANEAAYIAPSRAILSSHNVFSDSYSNRFESICRQYGRMLQHQSDRNLPRTYFNSKYLSITKKNGHEMAGLILVCLIIFLSDEGQYNMDKQIGANRCTAFIHVFELLLQLESFCKQESHSKNDLKIFEEGLPHVMYTIKEIINREQGCGMKLIKFHLIKHFCDDIMRYGSMKNFDSSIGERNHKSEVKEPAQHTQRRKNCFEKQTARRYTENISTDIAFADMMSNAYISRSKENSNDNEIKRRNIFFCFEEIFFFKRDANKQKVKAVQWLDENFQRQLKNLCIDMIESGSVRSPINFFTQRNQDDCIFRADPEYDNGFPWYDWGKVNWGNGELVPAKLLIFVDLRNNLLKSFKFGDCRINEPGCYAIGHSFDNEQEEKAHQISNLVVYGEVMCHEESQKPLLWVFPVESIMEHCISVPFKVSNNIINAKKWLILKSKDQWYQSFLEHLKENLD